ncbi:mini-circle protein [Nocardioides sp. Soil797]|nr:mini-circle protein [Nocardioides sp. Soil797]
MTETNRTDPPLAGGEAETLRAYLDYHRDTLRLKTEGLSQEQLSATLAPSTMTLGGMLKHLALVEDDWFSVVFSGNDEAECWRDVDWDADRDWDWHSAVDDTPEELRALFDGAVAASDAILDRVLADTGLETLSVRRGRRTDEQFSLRWIMVHLIEEYARHNGHADLIRESIDGVTGE